MTCKQKVDKKDSKKVKAQKEKINTMCGDLAFCEKNKKNCKPGVVKKKLQKERVKLRQIKAEETSINRIKKGKKKKKFQLKF